jgi:hypothetical protein
MATVERVACAAIWAALGMDARCQDNHHADRVAKIVQRYGLTQKARLRLTRGGKQEWCWVKPEAAADARE